MRLDAFKTLLQWMSKKYMAHEDCFYHRIPTLVETDLRRTFSNGRFEKLIKFPMAWTVQSYITLYMHMERPRSSRKASLEENWQDHLFMFFGFWGTAYVFSHLFNYYLWKATFVMAAIATTCCVIYPERRKQLKRTA